MSKGQRRTNRSTYRKASHGKVLRAGYKQQRAQHLARQARSAALKELRDGQPVWITVPDFDTRAICRCWVLPVPWDDVTFDFCGGKKALCLVERQLQVAVIVEKDGIRIYNNGYHVPQRQIFGLVERQHTRPGQAA